MAANGGRQPLAKVSTNSPRPTERLVRVPGFGYRRVKTTNASNADNRGLQPPRKKQATEIMRDHNPEDYTLAAFEGRSRLFTRKTADRPPTAFEKKLVAARSEKSLHTVKTTEENEAPTTTDKTLRQAGESQEEVVRQWQRHYRKAFPSYVFYFESVPEDVRVKAVRQITSLGAREETFFSKVVTHVVTTRSAPTGNDAGASQEDEQLTSRRSLVPDSDSMQSQTINPSLLARLETGGQLKGAMPTLSGKSSLSETGLKKQSHANHAGVLNKARDMGMKIWALEKFQRMMSALFDGNGAKSTIETKETGTKRGRDADLSQLLRNEKLTGPTDREKAVAAQEVVQFRGCYIYVHDMEEETRPVMARDYSNPSEKQDGKWPQFRITAPGRCPFVEDPSFQKKLALQQKIEEQERARKEKGSRKEGTQRSIAKHKAQHERKPSVANGDNDDFCTNQQETPEERTLVEMTAEGVNKIQSRTQRLEPPRDKAAAIPSILPRKRDYHETLQGPKGSSRNASNLPNPASAFAGELQAGKHIAPRQIGCEPIASGVQPSNITSAIRSQWISSTAPGPGNPAAGNNSREIYQLKRKLLERNSSNAYGMGSEYANEMRAAINGGPDRPILRPGTVTRGQESNAKADREGNEGTLETWRRNMEAQKSFAIKKAPKEAKVEKEEKDLKPGYCENCREKFEDFDSHIVSRKHRRFATNASNFKELDKLIEMLVRTPKQVYA